MAHSCHWLASVGARGIVKPGWALDDINPALSRETLLQEVWGYNSGLTTHTLETHIYRLRQKFEKDAAAPAILVTEAGGYKLMP